MILQDDWHARTRASQRQHLPRKIETVNVKNIGAETAKECARFVGIVIERQKMILHAITFQMFGSCIRLDHGYSIARL